MANIMVILRDGSSRVYKNVHGATKKNNGDLRIRNTDEDNKNLVAIFPAGEWKYVEDMRDGQ